MKTSKRLAQYLLRPAMAESRIIHYDPDNETVVFRARGPKDRKTGKRPHMPFRMRALEFLARLLIQVPSKGQKLVNYYGIYSNKIRGLWKKTGFRLRIRRRKKKDDLIPCWRSQIWRIYEADPLACPSCGEELIFINLVFPPFFAALARPP